MTIPAIEAAALRGGMQSVSAEMPGSPAQPLRVGEVIAGKVILMPDGQRGLSIQGVPIKATVPGDVPLGEPLKLQVTESASNRLVLHVVKNDQTLDRSLAAGGTAAGTAASATNASAVSGAARGPAATPTQGGAAATATAAQAPTAVAPPSAASVQAAATNPSAVATPVNSAYAAAAGAAGTPAAGQAMPGVATPEAADLPNA
ncbi:MAG: hypothetical protein AAGC46_12560, partial [Solirubrobacteraceae bacterium]|nr:hypothetical protein [Patulibacter sp.]